MADWARRLGNNVDGEFFVDSTCINCDTCRQLAPETFSDDGEYSYVAPQPASAGAERKALQALLACPTGSIGTRQKKNAREVLADFPMPLAGRVFYCGFNSEKSFGGNSYFIEHPDGNWLIDSPRYIEHLARSFEALGGIRNIFLTHRDDVADAAKWARRFGAQRIIHKLELSSQPDAEVVLEGTRAQSVAPQFLAIPTPGHTRGHMVLLYRDEFLFTGDHLWWSRERGRLNASRSVCWYSWPKQVESMAALLDYSFEWVLPGHGERAHLTREAAAEQVRGLVELMSKAA